MSSGEPLEDLPSEVAAEHEVAAVEDHAELHEEHAHVLFGAGPAVTLELGHGTLAGVGVFGSYVVVPGWLEVEGAALVEGGHEGSLVPVVLLLKKPFEVSHAVEPFIGVGPELIVVPAHGEGGPVVVELGGEAVVGTYVFFSRHVGASVEATFGGVRADEEGHPVALLEAGGAGRVVLRY